ncbi:unnamed protein product [Chilo suppressalis]|uniref:C2H2-type domain-containing protein n=1 Tax=Chilo suppressalis TaxID=168631 RepID=A0ABN8BAN3_CHISP|nr:unnamed protein product [Chilo suppressalis]
MLQETFNLTLKNYDKIKSLICDDCLSKLREADLFKKQVQASEEALLKIVDEQPQKKEDETSFKWECAEVDDYEFDDRLDDSTDDNFVWDVSDTAEKEKGQIYVIKLEPKKENEKNCGGKLKIEKNPAKPTAVRKARDKMEIRKVTKRKKQRTAVNERISKEKQRLHVRDIAPVSETQIASRENSLNLVLNSNMCLFKSLKTKFGCFQCKESFMTMPELREHSKTHSDVRNLKIRFNLLKGLSYKSVDVSGLTCNLCSSNCDGLEGLRSHLIDTHSIKFKEGGHHFLIPFNLESDFKCVLCSDKFNTFSRLAIHMNTHYAHNVCEICGVSYINRLSLRMHVSSVHKEKKCSQCSATFSTHYMKVKHMKKAHNVGSYKRYCLLCDKTFRYTYLLMEHKIKEHGAKRQISNCPDCGKTFLSPQNMKVHIRSVHIKERNYPCTVCGMRFFTKCDQKRHEMTHDDVKSFSCSYCDGKFKTKDSWRRHLKRQHEHMYEVQ